MILGMVAIALAAYLAMALYQVYKPLPPGIGEPMPLRAAEEVAFFSDETFVDAEGERRFEHAIYDEMLRLIGQAQRLIVLDVFLFNEVDVATAGDGQPYRPIASQLTQALIERSEEVPGLEIVVITDPINTFYGGIAPEHFAALREAGVSVIFTDLTQQRASNPTWSGLWHLCCRWLGNSADDGWLPSIFGTDKVTLRSYLALLNFNANHRKTLVVDRGDEWVGLVTSANPHDASSLHSNVALRFTGPAARDLFETERAVAAMSGGEIPPRPASPPAREEAPDAELQVLTEGRIGEALLYAVETSEAGDRLDIAVFYLAHRELIEALKAAQERGVELRVLLDPNKAAFGREKNGIPNRQAAHELHEAGVPVRWCDTQGEQCHDKLLMKQSHQGNAELILGSANFTRRNLDDLNLETSVRLLAADETPVMREVAAYFERRWNNEQGRRYSVAYPQYADDSRWRYWLYRFMEASGFSTF
ncbi:phospholipase D family protein [Halomonas sp. Bachu 37]|uniref:phospholipase D family protein n=1 Tax=Halomonas kashgarensis TaxID=3084920 RepID=UPI003217BC1B